MFAENLEVKSKIDPSLFILPPSLIFSISEDFLNARIALSNDFSKLNVCWPSTVCLFVTLSKASNDNSNCFAKSWKVIVPALNAALKASNCPWVIIVESLNLANASAPFSGSSPKFANIFSALPDSISLY